VKKKDLKGIRRETKGKATEKALQFFYEILVKRGDFKTSR
jgi:hypothetical protein